MFSFLFLFLLCHAKMMKWFLEIKELSEDVYRIDSGKHEENI